MDHFGFLGAIWLVLLPFAEAQSNDADQHGRPPLISYPAWSVPPAPRDGENPDFASVIGLPGRVTVNCLTLTSGRVSDCRVVSAIPAQIGFEPIALTIAQRGILIPARDAFGPREAPIQFSINFSTETEFERGRPWKGPKPNAAQMTAARPVILWMLEQRDFSALNFGLADLPPALQPQVGSWLVEVINQPSMQDAFVLAMARVMAKRGASVFPTEQPDDWAGWEKDFFLALDDQVPDKGAFDQVRQKFCRIYACRADS